MSELEDLLRDEFNDEEKQIFLRHFKQYIEYDDEKDFVINIEDIAEHIGIVKKQTIQNMLAKHFVENVHYKVKNEVFILNRTHTDQRV